MAGADGWRLDVVDELPDEFVLRLRRRIRQVKPSAILGEVLEDASNKIAYDRRRRYFVDNELHGVMNYPLQKAILRYVRRENDGAEFGQQVMTLAEKLPAPRPERLYEPALHARHTPCDQRASRSHDGSRDDLAWRHFSPDQIIWGKELLRTAAFLHIAPRRALHRWRRGRDDRLSRPFQPRLLSVGRGGHESASLLPCAGAVKREIPR
ncbi:MAG: hypothetical protein V8T01_04145 [Oscillospiraceae bacterium]